MQRKSTKRRGLLLKNSISDVREVNIRERNNQLSVHRVSMQRKFM